MHAVTVRLGQSVSAQLRKVIRVTRYKVDTGGSTTWSCYYSALAESSCPLTRVGSFHNQVWILFFGASCACIVTILCHPGRHPEAYAHPSSQEDFRWALPYLLGP